MRRVSSRRGSSRTNSGPRSYRCCRPDHHAGRFPGRKPLNDRRVLCGILFVLHTAIPSEYLPQELRFGSGMTCWRRLRDWNDAGVWQRLHEILLGKLPATDQLDMSRAVIDGSHIRALKGGPKTGPNPVDRRQPGSKHHVITDAGGIPLAASLTGGNRHDVTHLLPLIDKIPPIKGIRGRPRQRHERTGACPHTACNRRPRTGSPGRSGPPRSGRRPSNATVPRPRTGH